MSDIDYLTYKDRELLVAAREKLVKKFRLRDIGEYSDMICGAFHYTQRFGPYTKDIKTKRTLKVDEKTCRQIRIDRINGYYRNALIEKFKVCRAILDKVLKYKLFGDRDLDIKDLVLEFDGRKGNGHRKKINKI